MMNFVPCKRPWRLDEDDRIIYAANDRIVLDDCEEMTPLADLRLMAAGPELIAACRKALAVIERLPGQGRLADELRDAIGVAEYGKPADDGMPW